MATPAAREAAEFLKAEMPMLDTYDFGYVDKLIASKEQQIEHSIAYLVGLTYPDDITLVDFDTSASSAQDYTESYAELQAWANYVKSEGQEFAELYYETEAHSPFLLSPKHMDQAIAKGQCSESDKDIWQILFLHPDRSHFYWIKYLPGDEGEGWGYRVKASTHFGWFDSERRDRVMKRRYPLDQIVP